MAKLKAPQPKPAPEHTLAWQPARVNPVALLGMGNSLKLTLTVQAHVNQEDSAVALFVPARAALRAPLLARLRECARNSASFKAFAELQREIKTTERDVALLQAEAAELEARKTKITLGPAAGMAEALVAVETALAEVRAKLVARQAGLEQLRAVLVTRRDQAEAEMRAEGKEAGDAVRQSLKTEREQLLAGLLERERETFTKLAALDRRHHIAMASGSGWIGEELRGLLDRLAADPLLSQPANATNTESTAG